MIHSSAVVGPGVRLGERVVIGPGAVVGDDGVEGELVIGADAVIRSHAVIYRPGRIGARFHAGHGMLLREHAEVGDDVSIGSHSVVEHRVRIARGVRLHSRCFVPELTVMEEGAWLGPGVVVTNSRYPNEVDSKDRLEPVFIEAGAVVGGGSVILPGVRIGAHALVGAGAVVVRDVEPGAIVAGNPAARIGTRA